METAATTKAGPKTKPVSKRAESDGASKVTAVTVGELRTNFKSVEEKLAKGVRVQVTRRGSVVAEVVPAEQPGIAQTLERKKTWLEFLTSHQARMKEIWGETVLDVDTTALISEGRDRDFLL